MTPLNLAAIEKAAKEATPAPWRFLPKVGYLIGADKPSQFGPRTVQIGTIGSFQDAELLKFNRKRWVADGAFIALANPATILALCERIREPAKVKPLEWQERNEHWTAECVIGDGYSIDFAPDDEMELTPWSCWAPDGSLGHFRDLDDAKRACQADYDSRIRSALITETDNG